MKKVKDSEISPQIIAEYFLTKNSLTSKKIQKLVYYAYAWFITLYNEDVDNINNVLFDEDPEAWIHGPVFPSLYHSYKEHGWHEVERNNEKIVFDNPEVQDLMEQIWDVFGKYSADQLEYMTHQEAPWINARKDTNESSSFRNKISKRDIFVYYNIII